MKFHWISLTILILTIILFSACGTFDKGNETSSEKAPIVVTIPAMQVTETPAIDDPIATDTSDNVLPAAVEVSNINGKIVF